MKIKISLSDVLASSQVCQLCAMHGIEPPNIDLGSNTPVAYFETILPAIKSKRDEPIIGKSYWDSNGVLYPNRAVIIGPMLYINIGHSVTIVIDKIGGIIVCIKLYVLDDKLVAYSGIYTSDDFITTALEIPIPRYSTGELDENILANLTGSCENIGVYNQEATGAMSQYSLVYDAIASRPS